MKKTQLVCVIIAILVGCQSNDKAGKGKSLQLITLDPGHFHAALVQKTMYDDVDSVVHVYAPVGNDLQLHLDRINGYNNRKDNPTHWKEEVYSGDDFFDKMIKEKKGNVVVLSGNNQKKSEYILRSLQNGFNVLADKPMAIDSKGFEQLKQAFDVAKKNDLQLYDIMTERFEITTELQRELSMIPEIFGTLKKGTIDSPAVEMKSNHNFYKNVSGSVVIRPAWFMDSTQQGQGIVDVSTHLVDLVQWECFPEQILDYSKDIIVENAWNWPTRISVSQFKTITKLDSFPGYLDKNILDDTTLKVWSNGEISYSIKGVHAKIYVEWKYQTESGNDTHHSILKGTKATLIINQGAEEQYKPTLYIERVTNDTTYDNLLIDKFKIIQSKYPGVEIKKIIGMDDWFGTMHKWEVFIPDKYKEGHEAHFARVTQNFLEYLKNKNMPAWEVPNMLAKYYTTTKALEIALKDWHSDIH